ncbi:MAG: hypothetical protein WC374_04695 [Phycisphaerae bacterium]|jgi:hypothetical protein
MNEWISVDNEMPEPNVTVEVKYQDGSEGEAFWYYGIWRMTKGVVAHWRPSGISIDEYRQRTGREA